MNRKKFIKYALGGALIAPFLAKLSFASEPKSKKWGFIHIHNMPKGIHSGDVTVIDNDTNKPIKFHERDGYFSDGKPICNYCIQYADDTTGVLGGVVIWYENYDKKRGVGNTLSHSEFCAQRNFRFELVKGV